jgi:prepilin-type N-terminal cleavage/methylation domain-containing protein
MKSGFTLVELLVVLLLMTIVLSVSVPMGSKIFNQFKNYVKQIEDKHDFNQKKAYAFIEADEKNIILNDINYSISKKGSILYQ